MVATSVIFNVYIYRENQHLRSEYKDVTISEDIVKEIVEKLGPVLNEVTWHGGEPLLLPKSLLITLEEEKSKHELDFITTLQTNSVALDEVMRYISYKSYILSQRRIVQVNAKHVLSTRIFLAKEDV